MKKTIATFLAICLCIGLYGCGSREAITETIQDSQIVTPAETTSTTESIEPIATTAATEEPKPVPIELEVGKTYQVDGICSFVYNGVQHAEEITPTYSDFTLSFIDYLVSFDFEYTNLSEEVITEESVADFCTIFTHEKEWVGLALETEDMKKFEFEGRLLPGETRKLHFFADVSKSLDEAQLTLHFGDLQYVALFNGAQSEDDLAYLVAGDKQVVEDHGELTFLDAFIADSLYPENPSGYYRFLEADPNKVLVISKCLVKNLETEAVYVEDILTGTITAKGYKYEGFCAISVDNGQTLESDIRLDPLNEAMVYFVAQIPAELEDAEEIVSNIRFYGQSYTIGLP